MNQTSESITLLIVLYSKSIAVELHWHKTAVKYVNAVNSIVSTYVNIMRICAGNTKQTCNLSAEWQRIIRFIFKCI